jgi:hypothetical protein
VQFVDGNFRPKVSTGVDMILLSYLLRVETTKNIELVKRILNEIYDVYVNENNSNLVEQNLLSNHHGCSSCNYAINAVGESVQSGLKMSESFIKSADTVQQPIKSNLEIYLEDDVFIPEKGLKFSALKWSIHT